MNMYWIGLFKTRIFLCILMGFLFANSACQHISQRRSGTPSPSPGPSSSSGGSAEDSKNRQQNIDTGTTPVDGDESGWQNSAKNSSKKFNIPESDLVEHDPEDWNEEGPELRLQKRGSRPQFDWPVDEARLTRGFSAKPVRTKRSRRKRPHFGLDLAAPKGTPIIAAHDGTVIYVGKGFKGYGNLIVVEDPKGWATLYAHLHQSYVRQGQRVLQGERIGSMGKTGRAFGVHLHFEIRTLAGPVDPLDFLPQGAQVRSQLESHSSRN